MKPCFLYVWRKCKANLVSVLSVLNDVFFGLVTADDKIWEFIYRSILKNKMKPCIKNLSHRSWCRWSDTPEQAAAVLNGMFLSSGLFHQQLHSHLNEFAAKKTQTSLFHRSHHVPDLRHFWFLLSSFQTSQQIKTSSWVFFQEVVENIVNSRNTVRAKRLLDLVVCLSGIHVELGSVLVDVNRKQTLLNILCVCHHRENRGGDDGETSVWDHFIRLNWECWRHVAAVFVGFLTNCLVIFQHFQQSTAQPDITWKTKT